MTSQSGSNLSPDAATGGRASKAVRPFGFVRVAETSGVFWVITTLIAGVGGVVSDWLLLTVGPAALGIDVGILVLVFVLQLTLRRYIPAVYWLTMLGMAIVGTVGSDIFSFLLGVPPWVITIGYGIVIAGTLLLWHHSAGTISLRSINTRRRGAFYWLTVFFIFAFGTALVDLVAQEWHLGYLLAGILFAVLISVAAVAHLRFGANPVLAFWTAFMITRPLGACFAFFLALTPPDGLGGGDLPAAAGGILLVVVLVASAAVARRRIHDNSVTT